MNTHIVKILSMLLIVLFNNANSTETPKDTPWDSNSEAVYDLLVAQFQHADTDYSGSVDTLVAFAKKQKDDELSSKALKALIQTQRFSDAVTFTKQWADSTQSDKVQALYALALALGDKSAQAVDVISSAIASSKESSLETTEQQLMLYVRVTKSQWYQKQLNAFFKALFKRYPDSIVVRDAYLEQLRWHGLTDKALSIIDKALDAKPDDLTLIAQKSAMYTTDLDIDGASKTWQTAIQKSPKKPLIRLSYAEFLSAIHHYTEANEQLSQLLTSDTAESAQRMMVTNAISQGNIDEAERLYKLYMRDEASPEKTYYFGYTLMLNEQYQRAAHYLRPLTKINNKADIPDQVILSAMLAMGRIDYATGGDDAIKNGDDWFQRIQKTFSINKEAIVSEQTRALSLTGHDQLALKRINLLLQDNPNNAEIRYSRALLAADMGLDDIATEDLTILHTKSPGDIDIQNALGYTILTTQGATEQATTMITKAIFEQPYSAAIADSMGWLRYKQERYKEALPFFRFAYDYASDGEITGHYIMTLYKAHKPLQAKKLYQLAIRTPQQQAKIDTLVQDILPQLRDN